MGDIEHRIIECAACNQKHRLTLDTNYDTVLFDVNVNIAQSEEQRQRMSEPKNLTEPKNVRILWFTDARLKVYGWR